MFLRGKNALVSMLGLEMSPAHTLPGPAPESSLAPVLPGWGPRVWWALCLEGVILGGQLKALLLGSVATGSGQARCQKSNFAGCLKSSPPSPPDTSGCAAPGSPFERRYVRGRACNTFSEPELVTAVLSSNNRTRRSSFQSPPWLFHLNMKRTSQ